MLKRAWLLGVFCLAHAEGAAQSKVAISSVGASLRFGADCIAPIDELSVNIDRKFLPPVKDLEDASRWSGVIVFNRDGKMQAAALSIASVRSMRDRGQDTYPVTGGLILRLAAPLTEFPVRILVNLDYLNGSAQSWTPKPAVVEKFGKVCSEPVAPPQQSATAPKKINTVTKEQGRGCQFEKLGFFEAKKPVDEQMKLTGAWTTGMSTRPLYSIDAKMEIPFCTTQDLSISVGGTIKTAEKRSVDPDSFSAFLSLQPKDLWQKGIAYGGWGLKGGGEFARKEQLENIIVTPFLTGGVGSYKTKPNGSLRYSYGVEGTASVEAGVNRRTKDFRSGYGGIGRIAPSVTATLLFPMRSAARSLIFTSTYNPRFLLSPEPFTDQRIWIAHETPYRSFAKGTRHYWLNQITAELTPLVGFTVKGEFGSVPPAFNIIDYRLTTGIQMQWKWRE